MVLEIIEVSLMCGFLGMIGVFCPYDLAHSITHFILSGRLPIPQCGEKGYVGDFSLLFADLWHYVLNLHCFHAKKQGLFSNIVK
jgi:hypothetical protein